MEENEIDGLGDLGAGYEMDYAGIHDLAEDYDFYGLDAFVTPEMLKSHGIAAAAGGGGILAVMNVFDRVEYFADKPKGRALAEGLAGIVGGRLLWQVNRDAAMGFVGGVTGYALANLVNQYIAEMDANGNGNGTSTDGLSYTEVRNVPSYSRRNKVSVPARWDNGHAPLARDMVTRANYMQVDGLDEQLSSWIGG